ncbi:MAG: exodeoxyribonuclease VII large subunit [bacterium]|nr:exodeoxyribonuclease VII large subunit [bacterium]
MENNLNPTLTVTQLNKIAREMLMHIGNMYVTGEICDIKYKPGQYRYIYFTLKDPQTDYCISCAADPGILSKSLSLDEGKKVTVFGNLDLWEKAGRFQLSVLRIEIFEQGDLQKKVEALKQKLNTEGLFSDAIKKPIPAYPLTIGVITSVNAGAAWYDFKTHSIDKYPFLHLITHDVAVQGAKCITDVCKAIRMLDRLNCDVIVITRGGGSQEDLMAFNSEEIARAIYAASTPILTAIGHEIDTSIADFVADRYASTPTNAAGIITQNYPVLIKSLDHIQKQFMNKAMYVLGNKSQLLDQISYKLQQKKGRYKNMEDVMSLMHQKLELSANHLVKTKYEYLQLQQTKLNLISPLTILNRGYSIVKTESGKVLKDIKHSNINDLIHIQLAHGQLTSTIKEKHE